MGWFLFSRASAPTGVCVDASNSVPAASEGAGENTRNSVASKELPEKQPALTEAEQLDLLIGGVRLDDSEARDKAAFLRSNQRHMYLDCFLSCAAYAFSGLQHIQGQSNALTLLTMWTVGTTFLVDVAERKYLQGSLHDALSSTQLSNHFVASAESINDRTSVSASNRNEAAASASTAVSPSPLDAGKLAEQQRKIFMTQTVASWVWMLASFQQFKVYKRLKWCGYSSWMGLGCVSYFTTRHMYNLLVA